MQDGKITLEDVRAAHKLWKEGIVHIGKVAHLKPEDPEIKNRANDMLDKLYNFGYIKDNIDVKDNLILFKPTLAIDHPIRFNRKQTLSYFVGGDIEGDSGFALKPWKDVKFRAIGDENIFTEGEIALVMGIYTFVDSDEAETTVEYTFGYKRGEKKLPTDDNSPLEESELKIVLHHSSMPFSKD